MPGAIAALDADVLVPITTCDFLLTAFDLGIYQPVVSSATLDEVERSLREDFPHLDPGAIRRRVDLMRVVLADQLVDGESVDVPVGINRKDRHIVGAAIQGEATMIVTNDRRLRREITSSGLAILGIDLDTFVVGLWESMPAEVAEVIDTLIRKRSRRPVARSQMLDLIRVHMPALADRLAE